MPRRKLFVIVGSASVNSSNERLVNHLIRHMPDFQFTVFNLLDGLPPFNPEKSIQDPPQAIREFRKNIEEADCVIISTPEYIFSIPSGLKNAFEWCVATTVFSDKPTALITASADGRKGHEELQLIVRTLMGRFSADNALLISGIKGKINVAGIITDPKTAEALDRFMHALRLTFESVDHS